MTLGDAMVRNADTDMTCPGELFVRVREMSISTIILFKAEPALLACT